MTPNQKKTLPKTTRGTKSLRSHRESTSHPLPGTSVVGVYDPTAHHEVSHIMLLGRTTSLIVTKWYVWMHVGTQDSLYRFRFRVDEI
jgi:hypothetical protein